VLDAVQVLFQDADLDPHPGKVHDLEEVVGRLHHLADGQFRVNDHAGDGAAHRQGGGLRAALLGD
jgi:hypothetical protein